MTELTEPEEMDGSDLRRIREDLGQNDHERMAAAEELERRESMGPEELYELDCWTMA